MECITDGPLPGLRLGNLLRPPKLKDPRLDE